jgi:hypothetical protein
MGIHREKITQPKDQIYSVNAPNKLLILQLKVTLKPEKTKELC